MMSIAVGFELISGLVFGIEYFNEDKDTPFSIFIHLLFIRVHIYLNATVEPDDHNDLGGVG